MSGIRDMSSKYNTLDGNKDLVIGMRGSILNQLKEIGYKN